MVPSWFCLIRLVSVIFSPCFPHWFSYDQPVTLNLFGFGFHVFELSDQIGWMAICFIYYRLLCPEKLCELRFHFAVLSYMQLNVVPQAHSREGGKLVVCNIEMAKNGLLLLWWYLIMFYHWNSTKVKSLTNILLVKTLLVDCVNSTKWKKFSI